MSDLIERLTTFNPYATTKQEALQIEAADQLEAQAAEIARLREALDRVVSDADMAHQMGSYERSGYSIIRDHARAALEQKP